MVASLQMTLQRINAIERQFASLSQQTMLTVDAPKTDPEFQKILDKKVEDVKSGHTKGERVPNSEIDNLIEQYSAKNGLDKDFVKSVVRHESGFNVNATAQGLGVTNAYDAEQNIAGGTKYLKGLMDRFDNNKELALAAYNAGPNAVKKYGGVPPYKETQNYVKNIMKTYDNYKGGSN